MTPSITEAQIINAIGDFITLITDITAVKGQVNRVPSLPGNYAVMWPLTRPRLATNLHTTSDSKFTASIAGLVMTVTAVQIGSVVPGRQLLGTGIAANTTIGEQITGTAGGNGAYAVSVSQILSSQTMACGVRVIEESTEVVMQIDVHGPNSSDNAQTLQQLFWDSYAVDALEPSGIVPLYADDPRQMPFITAAKEYEDRWTVDLHMQVKPTITLPQEFFDSFTLGVVDVDVAFPPD